ncbi:MAG: glycosyltransferase family 2 protein [Conexivisphaerales archaeon]
MPPKKYSICITHYNNVRTVALSLDSILNQIDENFEVIVSDNFSNDGSAEILSKYAKEGKIRLVRIRSSRGLGRQMSFLKSTGQYIISNIDTDEVYLPMLKVVLSFYHKYCEGKLLLVTSGPDKQVRGLQNLTILPRTLAFELGGWRDLQYGEDWDLWARAAKRDKFCLTHYNLLASPNQHYERLKLIPRVLLRYIKYRDMMRLGRHVKIQEKKASTSQKVIYYAAKVSILFHRKYTDEFNREFNPYHPRYFVPWCSD